MNVAIRLILPFFVALFLGSVVQMLSRRFNTGEVKSCLVGSIFSFLVFFFLMNGFTKFGFTFFYLFPMFIFVQVLFYFLLILVWRRVVTKRVKKVTMLDYVYGLLGVVLVNNAIIVLISVFVE